MITPDWVTLGSLDNQERNNQFLGTIVWPIEEFIFGQMHAITFGQSSLILSFYFFPCALTSIVVHLFPYAYPLDMTNL